jgi:hypothetical protein
MYCDQIAWAICSQTGARLNSDRKDRRAGVNTNGIELGVVAAKLIGCVSFVLFL